MRRPRYVRRAKGYKAAVRAALKYGKPLSIKPSKALKNTINQLIKGKQETKEVHFYGGAAVVSTTGVYAGRAVTVQNGFISNFNTDFKRLCPFLAEGTGDNQRIGDQVRPVSLRVNARISLSAVNVILPLQHADIFAVLYVLEHKNLSTYVDLFPGATSATFGALQNGLNFNTLLDNGENTTVPFSGEYIQSRLPVSNYFKLLKKKIFRLRYSGSQIAGTGGTAPNQTLVSVDQSHEYSRNISFNIKCPKTLNYPQNLASGGGSSIVAPNDPQNFAPFMLIGFYRADGVQLTPLPIPGSEPPMPPTESWIDMQYHTVLRYKDA